MVDKKWVAFFSQTGSEILNISRRLGRFPDTIICNGFLDKTNDYIKSMFPSIRFKVGDDNDVDQSKSGVIEE